MRSPKMRRYAVIIAMALMLASVVALADVIYYYKGVITAQVTTPPLVFYSEGFPYTLNSYFSGYVNFTALSTGTGFTAKINLTNAYYAYFYHALGLVVNTPGWLYVTNVTTSGNNIIIGNMTIIVQDPHDNIMCIFQVISNGQPITNPPTVCPLSTGPYFISVLVQPVNPLSASLSETVTLYFGYNVVSNATVPLPLT
ncbi:hypothetical protein [Vulcanisaeta sp. EB80]|uniref:hypothetical protein n=1 Tax=Vulcanisaeta sp. EB80 TaxID=1650660 RepID=UPI00117DB294|nr:hypothetical protein [Vulcanisaeta sp. EB80]